MTIKFLRDHSVDSVPPESFTKGQVVRDRDEASEMHFVRRGAAGFLDEKSGDLFDHEGRPLEKVKRTRGARAATTAKPAARRRAKPGSVQQ